MYVKGRHNANRGTLVPSAVLTGLSDDDVVGHSRAVVVVGRALVRSLIRLRPFPADVDDQRP